MQRAVADLDRRLAAALGYVDGDLRWAIAATPAGRPGLAVYHHYDTASIDAEALLRSAIDGVRRADTSWMLEVRRDLDAFVDLSVERLLAHDRVVGLVDPPEPWAPWARGVAESLRELPAIVHDLNDGFRDVLAESAAAATTHPDRR